MAAKELSIFLPKELDIKNLLQDIVNSLSLSTIDIPADKKLSYQFLARKGEGIDLLEVEYSESVSSTIAELSEWEKPSQKYKEILNNCESLIIVYYRLVKNANSVLNILEANLGKYSNRVIVENGEGCLLLLSDFMLFLKNNEDWNWEKKVFPELPNVAESEWE